MILSEIVAVIVLYTKEESMDSPTLEMLIERKIKTYVYDNSNNTTIINNGKGFESDLIYYTHNPSNPGLAVAYNWVISQEPKKKWILLLDQDTLLNSTYFEALESVKGASAFKVILPQVVDPIAKEVVSPLRYFYGNRHKALNQSGPVFSALTAINSGSLLNIDTLRSIGFFNTNYPLDYLDHATFRKLNKEPLGYFVLDSIIEHDLSVKHITDEFPESRLISIIRSEKRFHEEEGALSMLYFYLYSAIHLMSYLKNRKFKILRITLKELLHLQR